MTTDTTFCAHGRLTIKSLARPVMEPCHDKDVAISIANKYIEDNDKLYYVWIVIRTVIEDMLAMGEYS
jgi:hypothetical protein